MKSKRIPGHKRNSIKRKQKERAALKNKLKKKISRISTKSCSLTYGVYQDIKDIIPKQKNKSKAEKDYKDLVKKEAEENIDKEFLMEDNLLEPLKRRDMTYISTYSVKKYFGEKKIELFNKISIDGQVLRDRRCSYVVDTLNTLSTQPGLLMRLFHNLEINNNGVYLIWLNINGKWEQIVIDDVVPIFGNKQGKAQFLNISPNIDPNNTEIWMILLFKALGKAYGGYHNLYLGNQNYLLKDLTGAPVAVHNIIHIDEKQKIGEREVEHINNLWNKLKKILKKGYPTAVSPRPPTEHEKARNDILNIHNKRYYLDKGLYYGHSYAIVTAIEVKNLKGEKVRLVKLRNPWINEKWKGEWSMKSQEWTQKKREILNYPYQEKEGNEFWIPLRNMMGYFEDMIVCKAKPNNVYSICSIEFPEKNFVRAVIRLSIKEKGKYSISVDQIDPALLGSRSIKNVPVKLSLCKLENDEFKMLSYTSSNSLRNTYVRKLIEPGEYFILVEQNCTNFDNKNISETHKKIWRNINLTIYGPQTCGMKVIECEDIHIIHDFLLYESWKSFAIERVGRRVSSFNLTFKDGHQTSLSIHMLNVPNSVVYVFKNDNEYGVDINTEMIGIKNLEVIGPEGKVGFNQHFQIDSGQCDIFILRQTEKLIECNPNEKQKFQVKSIIGTRYFGKKKRSKNQSKVYDFMYYDIPFTTACTLEKYPEFAMFGLYNSDGKAVDLSEQNFDIKIKKKSVIQAPRANSKALVMNLNRSVSKESQETPNIPKPKKIDNEQDKRINPRKAKIPRSGPAQKSMSRGQSKSVEKLREKQKLVGKAKRESKSFISNSNSKNPDVNQREKQLDKLQEEITNNPESRKNFNKDFERMGLSHFLGMKKEKLLEQQNKDVLKLIGFMGIDAFCGLYDANQNFLDLLYKKLERGDEKKLDSRRKYHLKDLQSDVENPEADLREEEITAKSSSYNYSVKENRSILTETVKDSGSILNQRETLSKKVRSNKQTKAPVLFYTEDFNGEHSIGKITTQGEINPVTPRRQDNDQETITKKLFNKNLTSSKDVNQEFKKNHSNFKKAFSKNIFKRFSNGTEKKKRRTGITSSSKKRIERLNERIKKRCQNKSRKGKTSRDKSKLGKIEIQQQKLKNSIVKNHLKKKLRDFNKTPNQENSERKNVFSNFDRSIDQIKQKDKNVTINITSELAHSNGSPMKQFFPKTTKAGYMNRTSDKPLSSIENQSNNTPISDFQKKRGKFFNSPPEFSKLKKKISCNRSATGMKFNSTRFQSRDKTPKSKEIGQINSMNRLNSKIPRGSRDHVGRFKGPQFISNPQRSIGNTSVASYGENKLQKSPPYSLLRSGNIIGSVDNYPLVSSNPRNLKSRSSRTKLDDEQRRFLTNPRDQNHQSAKNISQTGSIDFARCPRGLVFRSNKKSMGTVESKGFGLNSIQMDSEMHDIDAGGAIVDLKLVQNSVGSSNRNVKRFGDHGFISSQENFFHSKKKSRKEPMNLSRSGYNRGSLNQIDQVANKNSQDPVFSFRETNILRNRFNSRSRKHSKESSKSNIPVLKLKELTQKMSRPRRLFDIDIPYEGHTIDSTNMSKGRSVTPNNPFSQLRIENNRKAFQPNFDQNALSRNRSRRLNDSSYLGGNRSNKMQAFSMLNLQNRSSLMRQGEEIMPRGRDYSKDSRKGSNRSQFDLGQSVGDLNSHQSYLAIQPMNTNINVVLKKNPLKRPFEIKRPNGRGNKNYSKRSYDSSNGFQRENRIPKSSKLMGNSSNNFMERNDRGGSRSANKRSRKNERENSLLSQGFNPGNCRNAKNFTSGREKSSNQNRKLGLKSRSQKRIREVDQKRRSYNF